MKLDASTLLLGACAVGIGICAVEAVKTNRLMAVIASTQDDIGEMMDSHLASISTAMNTFMGE